MSAAVLGRADAALGPAADRKKARDVTRIQLDMPPRSVERLNSLKDRTEASSYAEVMRNALRLYEAVIQELEAGREFYIREPSGALTPYRIFVDA